MHFQSFQLRILMEKILSVFLKLNFSPNTLGCYGLVGKSVGQNRFNFQWTEIRTRVTKPNLCILTYVNTPNLSQLSLDCEKSSYAELRAQKRVEFCFCFDPPFVAFSGPSCSG